MSIKIFCGVVFISQDTNILEFNQYWKSDNTPSIISTNFESLIKKIDAWKNNPEKTSTTKLGEHTPCKYSLSTIWIFAGIKIKHNIYRAEDSIKKFL